MKEVIGVAIVTKIEILPTPEANKEQTLISTVHARIHIPPNLDNSVDYWIKILEPLDLRTSEGEPGELTDDGKITFKARGEVKVGDNLKISISLPQS
jgi:hypothetical protein